MVVVLVQLGLVGVHVAPKGTLSALHVPPSGGNWIWTQFPGHVMAAAGDARLSMMIGAVHATAPVAATRLMMVRRSIPGRSAAAVSGSLISVSLPWSPGLAAG
jgi:hypothetical protein